MTLEHVIVVGGTLILAMLAMLIHYEASFYLRLLLDSRKSFSRRARIMTMTSGLFCSHIAQIWLFGTGAWLLLELFDYTGTLGGIQHIQFLDFIYLSAASYTTVGYGDIFPLGHIRFLFGTESLVGFMLLTWSASLTFVEIRTHWQDLENSDTR
ncbi:ion channel [uncultured Halopseudomonas sp.]|uniref:ion channel n=1 Tax=uncultured Halopseudomonas sp. TaxID=2901193 RepID=UPI0030EE123A